MRPIDPSRPAGIGNIAYEDIKPFDRPFPMGYDAYIPTTTVPVVGSHYRLKCGGPNHNTVWRCMCGATDNDAPLFVLVCTGSDLSRSAQVQPPFEIVEIEEAASVPKYEEPSILRHRDIIEKCATALSLAISDIGQTARANQANLTGVDLVFPGDGPYVSSIGTTIIHQPGIDESLRVRKVCQEALRGAYLALDEIKKEVGLGCQRDRKQDA